jgi:hypothetical protein
VRQACPTRPFRPAATLGRRLNRRSPYGISAPRPVRGAPASCRSSVVEHPLGKGEVHSSILCGSTIAPFEIDAFSNRAMWATPSNATRHDTNCQNTTATAGEAWGSVRAMFASDSATVRRVMAGPNPHKLYSFAELRAVFGPLWVRCDHCRRFRSLRITSEIRDLNWRLTRFKCGRCGGPGYCTIERPNKEPGMEDYEDA